MASQSCFYAGKGWLTKILDLIWHTNVGPSPAKTGRKYAESQRTNQYLLDVGKSQLAHILDIGWQTNVVWTLAKSGYIQRFGYWLTSQCWSRIGYDRLADT